MGSPHRTARLAAASLHLPVNPSTGGRLAHYEREDPLEDLAAARTAALEELEKAMRPARASADYNTNSLGTNRHTLYEDVMNFSDISHSNEEYFRKLKELKFAHEETMAKLEKMSQEKLNLNESQPGVIREQCSSISCSTVSEKNSYQPVLLMSSFSEPDLVRSPTLCTSEEDLPSLEQEQSNKRRLMAYAKELINNMWTNFCVEDYMQAKDSDFKIVGKGKKKSKEWVPTITVPVPFQMMIREQKKKEEAARSRSDDEAVRRLLKKQEEEDLECRKKFRANPVPECVLHPLYQDIIRRNEERRKIMKEKTKAALLASQKPFKFIAREEQKQAAREKQLRDFLKCKKKRGRFKARPVPPSIYGPAASAKLREEEFLRDIRAQLRAQELLQSLSRSPRGSACKHFRNPKGLGQAGKLGCKHRCRCQTLNDEGLPEKYRERCPEHCHPRCSTAYKPFYLHESSSELAKRQKILADIIADEDNLKETCPPGLLSPGRGLSTKPKSWTCSPPMPTVCSRLRGEAIRRSLEEKKMVEEERTRILTKQKQRMKELQKLLTTRVKAYDSHQSLAHMSKSKVNYLRYHDRILNSGTLVSKLPFVFLLLFLTH